MGLKELVLLAALTVTGCHTHNYTSKIPVVYYVQPDIIIDEYPDHMDFLEKVQDRYGHKVKLIVRCTAKDGNDDDKNKCRSYRVGISGASVNGETNWRLLNSKGYDKLPTVIVDGKRVMNDQQFCNTIGELENCLD